MSEGTFCCVEVLDYNCLEYPDSMFRPNLLHFCQKPKQKDHILQQNYIEFPVDYFSAFVVYQMSFNLTIQGGTYTEGLNTDTSFKDELKQLVGTVLLIVSFTRIMKTSPCSVYPLKHRLWVLVRTASLRRF